VLRPYFPARPGEPPPLRGEISRVVRFEEVDAVGIVWHGRYASFLEDARVALGDRLGVGYLDYHAAGVVAPIKKLHIDYHLPLFLNERFTVEATMHWTEAARIDLSFVLRNGEGKVATTGYSVQMMLDAERNLLLAPPEFHRAFLERWRAGEVS